MKRTKELILKHDEDSSFLKAWLPEMIKWKLTIEIDRYCLDDKTVSFSELNMVWKNECEHDFLELITFFELPEPPEPPTAHSLRLAA
jgi:hypothetical protein